MKDIFPVTLSQRDWLSLGLTYLNTSPLVLNMEYSALKDNQGSTL